MKLFRHNPFRFYHQLESTDCGPACLAMVASSYGIHPDLKAIKNLCEITRMGVSVQDISNGAKKMGFETMSVKVTLEQLQEVPLPSILFWKQDHFIVLRNITKKGDRLLYHLADPGYGNIILEEEMVVKEWMGNNNKGVAIILQPQDNFQEATGAMAAPPRTGARQLLQPVWILSGSISSSI
jgi:ATP-binding cassette, subfamily B, bacterial